MKYIPLLAPVIRTVVFDILKGVLLCGENV